MFKLFFTFIFLLNMPLVFGKSDSPPNADEAVQATEDAVDEMVGNTTINHFHAGTGAGQQIASAGCDPVSFLSEKVEKTNAICRLTIVEPAEDEPEKQHYIFQADVLKKELEVYVGTLCTNLTDQQKELALSIDLNAYSYICENKSLAANKKAQEEFDIRKKTELEETNCQSSSNCISMKDLINISNSDINYGSKVFDQCEKLFKISAPGKISSITFNEQVKRIAGTSPAGDYIQFLNGKKKNLATSQQRQAIVKSVYEAVAPCAGLKELFTKYQDYSNETPQTPSRTMYGSVCRGYGSVTRDYNECVSLTQLVDNFALGKQGLNMFQQVDQQYNQLDIQADLTESVALGNSTTNSQEAMKRSIDKQTQHQLQNAAVSAAEFGTLISRVKTYPSIFDARTFCKEQSQSKELAEIIATKFQIADVIDLGVGNSSATPCEIALSRYGGVIFANAGILNQLKGRMYQSGMETAMAGLQAALSNKFSNDLGDNIDALNQRREDELANGGFDPNLLMNQCQVNPNLPACASGGLPPGVGFNPNTTTNTVPSITNPNNPDDEFDDVPIGDTGDGALAGEAILEFEDELNGSVRGQLASGARPGLGGTGSGEGGGAGGGAGGGGAASGGVSAKDFEQQSGSAPSRISDVGGSGGGGSGGALFRSRGGSSNKDLANVFKKKNSIRNGIMNFNGRNPASVGGASGNLFQRISKQYSSALKNNRLHNYEQVK